MNRYWVCEPNSFSAEECDKIIEYAMTLPSEKSSVGTTVRDFYRRSLIRWVRQEDERFSWVFDKLWRIMITNNDKHFKFNVHSLHPIQFTEYDESYLGEYNLHQDLTWVNSFDTHRKISMSVQLSDPATYEGGDFVFDKCDQPNSSQLRARGTVLTFPSFMYHKVTPVTKGRRYSLVAWFKGPKFV
jgi:PKHD-type hydroxylase